MIGTDPILVTYDPMGGHYLLDNSMSPEMYWLHKTKSAGFRISPETSYISNSNKFSC